MRPRRPNWSAVLIWGSAVVSLTVGMGWLITWSWRGAAVTAAGAITVYAALILALSIFGKEDIMGKAPQYRIVSHPDWGFCAMVNHKYLSKLPDWVPLEADGTTGLGGDSYRSIALRKYYWVPTEAEAGARVDLHATESGIGVVWAGG